MCVCEERGIVITNYGNKEDTNVEKENTAELCSVLLYYVKQNKKNQKSAEWRMKIFLKNRKLQQNLIYKYITTCPSTVGLAHLHN